jgi:hypothetical protein
MKVPEAHTGEPVLDEKRAHSPIKVPELETADDLMMRSLPEVAASALSREFETAERGIEITSLDVAPHGCYVFAGCSNGMILLFDMSSSNK